MKKFLFAAIALGIISGCTVEAQVPTFRETKISMVEIFKKLDHPKTIYCGCDIVFPKRGGFMPDLESCGYVIRSDAKRASHIEAEHIMPAWEFGRNRSCWKKGHRRYCQSSDEQYQIMETDLHNIYPAIGEVNADRSNFRYVETLFKKPNIRGYGRCEMQINTHKKLASPPERARGIAARAYLYMSERYNIPLSDNQRAQFEKWDRTYKPDTNECLRNLLIEIRQGNDNPYVSRACKTK